MLLAKFFKLGFSVYTWTMGHMLHCIEDREMEMILWEINKHAVDMMTAVSTPLLSMLVEMYQYYIVPFLSKGF